MIEPITAQYGYTVDIQRLRADVRRLMTARYFVFFLGAAILSILAAQLLWLGGSVTVKSVAQVILIAVLGPGLVWAVSTEELRLRRALMNQNFQVRQRTRELVALNRMAQAHLTSCPASVTVYSETPEGPEGPPQAAGALAERADTQPTSDFRNHIGLDAVEPHGAIYDGHLVVTEEVHRTTAA